MPKRESLTDKLATEAEAHTEQAFIIKSLLLVFGILFLRLTMGKLLFWGIITFAIFNYAIYLWVNTDLGIWGIFRKNISLTGAPRIAGKERHTTCPWGTWGIVAANVIIFLCIQSPDTYDFLRNNLYFPPADLNLVNLPFSLIANIYLHANWMHLFGNMCFLWGVGRVVERRIGTAQFLKVYHLTGIAGSIMAATGYVVLTGEAVPGCGASGAISGIMGVFLIRCYFKKMTFPFPAFGLLPVNLNLQLNGLIAPLLYFSMDLRGGLGQMAGMVDTSVGYLDHLFGMVLGVWMAWRMKLGEKASAERHLDIGDGVFDGKDVVASGFEAAGGFAGARKSLLIALDKESENPDTLLALARIESHLVQKAEGREYYQKAIKAYFPQAPERAVEVFREYYPKYRGMLDPALQFRIAAMLQRQGHLELSEQALMQLADNPAISQDLREQALFYSGRILEQLELPEPAERYYRRFLEEYPQSPRLEAVQARLAQTNSTAVTAV